MIKAAIALDGEVVVKEVTFPALPCRGDQVVFVYKGNAGFAKVTYIRFVALKPGEVALPVINCSGWRL